MSQVAGRSHQMSPVLTVDQIAVARRFASGEERRFTPDEAIFAIGDRHVPSWLVLEGTIVIHRRHGLDGEATAVEHGAGQFTGEVSQLADSPSLAAARAGTDGCLALPFDAPHLRALMVGSAEIGELMMRALILRRVDLIEDGGAGTILIGDPDARDLVAIQGFLTRSGYPNTVLDPAIDAEARRVIERGAVAPADLPLVICPDGTMLRRPAVREVAACLGMIPDIDPERVWDMAVVGAGPAGLAAAVYAASEGLDVLVLDGRTVGGQAGASNRIENYLGFPTGISGQALAGRAFSQALKFGAEVAIPLGVDTIDCDERPFVLTLTDGQRARARSIVVASGAYYRRPPVPDLARYEGAGVSYWASPVEARLCRGEEIALVGGGNSAGQAVAFLAPQVKTLHLIVRRPLAQTMSRYLIDRIDAFPNVVVHVGAEVVALGGDDCLESATIRGADGEERRCAMRHLFLFIGADPNAEWLGDCVATDGKGFIRTGEHERPLETSVPGIFAIGDVRAGSVKRVAAAVGEGAAVVAQVHQLLDAVARTE